MAREIVLNLGGEVSHLPITRVNRSKLYGRKRRVIVDQAGEPCVAGLLTRDGSALIPSGGVANIYTDDHYHVVERKDLQAVDADGNPVEPVPSTLGVELELEGPVDPTVVLDHVTSAVYQLDAEEIGAKLKESLENGDIYKFRFSYRSGFSDSPAFVVANDAGFFALVGDPSGFEFIYRDVAVEEDEDDTDPFEDDFDFSMM